MSDVVQQINTNLGFVINTFEKTLIPFTVFLGFIGVPVQTTPGSASHLKLLWSCIVLLLNLSFQFGTLALNIKLNLDFFQNKRTFFLAVNSLFCQLNFSVYVIFCHLCLLKLSKSNIWQQFSDFFDALEKCFDPTQHFYQQSRKVVIFFINYYFLSVCYLLFYEVNY